MSYVRQVDAHYCSPPPTMGAMDDWVFEGRDFGAAPRLKPGVRLPQVGDVWECDVCGKTWVLRPWMQSRYYVSAPDWTEETKRERRIREKGTRWQQLRRLVPLSKSTT